MKSVKSLEYAANVLLPFHLAFGDKYDDAVHRLSSALGAADWTNTVGKVRCLASGKVTVGEKSVTMLADGAPTTILFNVATQLALVTGGVSITSTIPKACQAWFDESLKSSKDGLTGWTRGEEGKIGQGFVTEQGLIEAIKAGKEKADAEKANAEKASKTKQPA